VKRLFLDANLLFTAAHNPQGKAILLLELAGAGCWEAVTSSYAVEEARRNLLRKFPDRLDAFEALLALVSVIPSPSGGNCPLPLPPKDRPIFEAALAGSATHLLTGDIKDFGPFMNEPGQTKSIVIQTVAEFLRDIGTE
jgi:predicted nucleic acid-binding protein